MRQTLKTVLSTDPEIEVIATAPDPLIAAKKMEKEMPDVLMLDIEMPRMDGLTFLRLIMEHRPMPVIIMSSLTQRGSQTALEALRIGAVDVLGKPGDSYSFGNLGPQLIEKIKAAAIAKIRRQRFASPPSATPPPDSG